MFQQSLACPRFDQESASDFRDTQRALHLACVEVSLIPTWPGHTQASSEGRWSSLLFQSGTAPEARPHQVHLLHLWQMMDPHSHVVRGTLVCETTSQKNAESGAGDFSMWVPRSMFLGYLKGVPWNFAQAYRCHVSLHFAAQQSVPLAAVALSLSLQSWAKKNGDVGEKKWLTVLQNDLPYFRSIWGWGTLASGP